LRFAGAKVLLFLELPKFLCKNFIFREKSCNFATVNITFARLLAAWPQPRTFIDTPYMKKERLNLEYPLTAKSQSLVWEQIGTLHGLERWLADNIDEVEENVIDLTWGEVWTDHHTLRARITEQEKPSHIRLRWVDEEDPEAYWEMRIGRSELTGDLCLYVTDYAPADDIDDLHELWDGNMERLHQVSGL
jgi:uncharacterized protein YndB with AHSA1/START domain